MIAWGRVVSRRSTSDHWLIAAERARLSERGVDAVPVEIIDRSTWEAMWRRAETRFLQFAADAVRILHRAENQRRKRFCQLFVDKRKQCAYVTGA